MGAQKERLLNWIENNIDDLNYKYIEKNIDDFDEYCMEQAINEAHNDYNEEKPDNYDEPHPEGG